MNVIQCLNYCPIVTIKNCLLGGIAIDNNYTYYSSADCCCIFQMDDCHSGIKQFNTVRRYGSIAFDKYENVFYALGIECRLSIYKLDKRFNEIDCITPQFLSRGNCIRGICCCDENYLIISGDFGIVKICKCCGVFVEEICSASCSCIEVVNNGVMTGYNNANSACLCFLEECKQSNCCYLPCGYRIVDLALSQCENDSVVKVLLIKQGCYPYLLLVKITKVPQLCCEVEPTCKCLKRCKCDSTTDLIQSVALIEASLSHILNAEGEKIQKVLSMPCDFCQIIDTNKSVQKTIISVTSLEQVLLAKLQLANELSKCQEKICD